jgi:ComF family protein
MPAFKSVRSYGLYKGTLKKALNLLKYYGIKRLSKPLSDKITGISLPSVDTVIPVPLSKLKLRQRGFNQSALLAKSLADRTDTRLSLNSLVKLRDTAPQVGLSAKKRQENIKNTFAVNGKETIINKNVLLVDDVFTTGATIRECSKVLNKAGANEIYVITLAHSSSDD